MPIKLYQYNNFFEVLSEHLQRCHLQLRSPITVDNLAELFESMHLKLPRRSLFAVYLFSGGKPNFNSASTLNWNKMNTWLAQNYLPVQSNNQRLRSYTVPIRKPDKLPPINRNQGPQIGSMNSRIQHQLVSLINIFNRMDQIRQQSGLVPINDDENPQQLQIPSRHIPYDSQLHSMNTSIDALKIEAQKHIRKLLQFSKLNSSLKTKIEQAINKFQGSRLEANQKVGRLGAMKAHKRLIDSKNRELKTFGGMQFGERDDILKAAKLYALIKPQEDSLL